MFMKKRTFVLYYPSSEQKLIVHELFIAYQADF